MPPYYTLSINCHTPLPTFYDFFHGRSVSSKHAFQIFEMIYPLTFQKLFHFTISLSPRKSIQQYHKTIPDKPGRGKISNTQLLPKHHSILLTIFQKHLLNNIINSRINLNIPYIRYSINI